MRKVFIILLSLAALAFAGNFQKKSENDLRVYQPDGTSYEEPRVDTVYIEKPVEYRYGRVYVKKTTYFNGTEHNQGVRVYYKSTAPTHCVNVNCKDRHVH